MSDGVFCQTKRFAFCCLGQVPTDFIRKIVILLNKGSIHSSMTLSDDCSGSVGLREDFAKNCFETLLEFSLLDTEAAAENDSTITNRLAITSLLQRFKEVETDCFDLFNDRRMIRNNSLMSKGFDKHIREMLTNFLSP